MQATKYFIDTSDKHMQTFGEAKKPNQPPAKRPDSRALERVWSYSAPIAYVLVQARIRLFRNPFSLKSFQIIPNHDLTIDNNQNIFLNAQYSLCDSI
jgi:hypothetical protein